MLGRDKVLSRVRTSKGMAKAPGDGCPDLVEDRQIGPRKSQDFRVVA